MTIDVTGETGRGSILRTAGSAVKVPSHLDGNLEIDWWIPLLAYSAIAVETIWGGWKIIETMGLRITTLRASSGLAANVGAVAAIFGATGLGVPISTTHAAASSITGSGVASGQGVD